MSTLCKQCGTELHTNDRVCDFCGLPIDGKYFAASCPLIASTATSPVAAKRYQCTGCKAEYSKPYKFCPSCRGKIVEVNPKTSQKTTSDADGLKQTACDYRDGTNGKKKSAAKALDYFGKAVEAFAKIGDNKNAANCCHSAGRLEYAQEKYEKENAWYERALQYNPDYAWPYYDLAINYRDGNGVDSDDKKAVEYYSKAAILFEKQNDKGYASDAYCEIGNAEYRQDNYIKAKKWYEKALSINPDNPNAMTGLAEMYRDGDGVAVDLNKAVELYILADKNDSDCAADELEELGYKKVNGKWTKSTEDPDKLKATAIDYRDGKNGKGKSASKAVEYFGKAVDAYVASGDKKSAASCCNSAGIVENKQENYKQENAWYEKAIKLCPDYPWAYTNLASNYKNGYGVTADHEKAAELYGKAADCFLKEDDKKEAANAANRAGMEEYSLKHYTKENAWYEKAMKYDPSNPDAPRNLGINYQNGNGVSKNFAKAAKYYILADKNGNSKASSDLSEIGYEKYKGEWLFANAIAEKYDDAEDYPNALTYFKKAYQAQEKEGDKLNAGLSCGRLACCAMMLGDKKSTLSWGKKALERLPEGLQTPIVNVFKDCGIKKQKNGEWGIPETPEDVAIKATSFVLNGKRFTLPHVKSLLTMLQRFSENVTNANDVACWCKNGVKDDCNGNCRTCILCSNNGIPQEKIMAFTTFCNWIKNDPDLCKKLLIPKY